MHCMLVRACEEMTHGHLHYCLGCFCVPGASNFSSAPNALDQPAAAEALPLSPAACLLCEVGKYRPGLPTFQCLSDDDRCPCAVAPQGAESGTISLTREQYGSWQTCEWLVHGGSGVELHVRAVDTEQFYDFVQVFGCTSPMCYDATELASITGRISFLDGEATFRWPNYMKLVFSSDGSLSGNGFVADFRIQTPDSCTSCPANSNTLSVLGSDSVYECKCLPDFDGPDGGPCTWCRDCQCHSSCAMCRCDEICNECRCAPGFELDFARVDVGPGSEYAPVPLTLGCTSPGACSCQTFTAFQGTFSDGSKGWVSNAGGGAGGSAIFSDYRYIANSRCRWVIAPPGVDSIRVLFNPGSQVMMDDSVTINECDDVSCSVKRPLGIFNGIILLPGNKAMKLGTGSSEIIDATALMENSPGLIKQNVEYTSSTGIIEVIFQTGPLITAYSTGFELGWESGLLECHECAAGKFKDEGVDTSLTGRFRQCTPCPPNTESSPGAIRITQCMCVLGFYYAVDTGACEPCAAGKFGAVINGDQTCQNCPRNTYAGDQNSSSCTPCPLNSLSEPGSIECDCVAGYTARHGAGGTRVPPLCWACAAGKYKTSAGASPCSLCAPGTYSSSEAGVSPQICRACPPNSFSQDAGSVSPSNCTCIAGHYSASGHVSAAVGCVPCEEGTFKAKHGMQACSKCAAGLYSAPGASTCRRCPEFSYSEAGGVCGCFKGFTGPNNGPCRPCEAATYKDVNGSSSCLPCPPSSWAPAAAISLSACTTALSGEVLKIKISLPLSMIEYQSGGMEINVRNSVAAAAGVDASRVQIVSIVEVVDGGGGTRRLLSASIALQIAIDMPPGQTGPDVLAIDHINQELGRRGLPQATFVETPTFFDCSLCPSETFQTSACTVAADRQCQGCRAHCNLGYWERSSCTPHSDRLCSLCTWCKTTEYQLSPCSTASDRVCHACTTSSSTQWLVAACTWTKDAEVAECSTLTCHHGQYRQGCGWGSQGQCVKCDSCADGQFRPTIAADGVGCGEQDPGYCEFCPIGSFSIGYALNCTYCRSPCSDVDSLEYESSPCRPIGDRVCSPCTSLPTCAEGMYRKGCAAESAGECTLCEPCPMGQQRQDCAGLSPGTCVACPGGFFNADAADSIRAPVTYVDWRVRTTAPLMEWNLRKIVFRDAAGSSLVVPLQDTAIASPRLADARAGNALLQPFNAVRLQRENLSSSFFLGWSYAAPTAVANIEIHQAEPLPDMAYQVLVQGRNRVDFTGRLVGACADRARAPLDGTSRQELVKYTAAGDATDAAAADCLRLCQITLLPGATGCEFVQGEGCYVHTSPSIRKADGRAGHFCWLAKPLQWHTIMSADFAQTAAVLTIRISQLTHEHGCLPCSQCNGEHEHIAVACNASADAVCGSCSALECTSSGLVVTAIGDEWRQGCGGGVQGECVLCDTCGTAEIRYYCRDENPGSCEGCLFGRFSVGNMPTCDLCTECTEDQFIKSTCAATQDRVCKDCSERAAELNCPGGSYLGNCGGGLRSKGYCLPCAACAPGSYRTGCTDRDPGSCVPCENGTFSDTYSSAPACGDCAQECALGLMQTHDCTALQNRLCAPATCVMCPLGSFTAGCNVDLSIAGACQSCAECAPGERRVGCGALSEGACEACPARTFQPLSTAASSCLPCTEQSCAQDEFVLHECSATADRQCATCSQAALACAQGSYLQGCGGPFPGNCTACPPCEAGHFRTSCNGTSVGECVPCPSGSYNPGTGDPLACIPCTSSCNATNTSTRSSSNISQHNPTLPDLLQVPQRISALRGSPAVRKLRIRGCHVSFDCSCAHCVYASATRTHARMHAHTHTYKHTWVHLRSTWE